MSENQSAYERQMVDSIKKARADELTSFWYGDILLPIDAQASLVMQTVIFACSGQLRRC